MPQHCCGPNRTPLSLVTAHNARYVSVISFASETFASETSFWCNKMSLYRLCPWWTAQCPDTGPNYDAASMHSAILNDDGGELLLVGSHSGYLSIFLPHQQSPTTSSNNNNAAASNANKDDDVDDAGEFHVAMVVEQQQPQRPVDLVLEVKLDQPILAVSSAAAVAR